MKSIFKLITSISFFMTVAFISCQDGEEFQNTDASFESIEAIVLEMKKIANTKNKAVYADITLDKKNRFVAKKIEVLSEFEKGFAEGFSGKKLKESITVSCSDGTDTHCEGSGFSLYRCIGGAIKDCFDGGGCAEVCSAGMKVEPGFD